MRAFALLAVLAVAGCDAPPPPPPAQSGPLPPALCDTTSAALARLAAGIENDHAGNAVIAHDAWLAMSPDQRRQLARLIAIDAACANPDGTPDRRAIIRSEFGQILIDTIVPISPTLALE